MSNLYKTHKTLAFGLLVMFMFVVCSCQKYDITNGHFFVKSKSNISNEDSLDIAKNKIYTHLAEYVCKQTDRTDTNIIYYAIQEADILHFDNYEIKNRSLGNSHNTSITIDDKQIQNRLDSFIADFKREGKIQNNNKTTYRAHASIDYPDSTNLYTKSVLERDAFRRAVEQIKKELLADGVSEEKAGEIISRAYMVEETLGQKVYTVVVEVSL